MTRLTAKERIKISTKAPVVPAINVLTGVTQVARHLICTQCGLVALEERYRNGPYESKSRIQRYGGSLVSPTGRMGDRPGVIIWELPEDLTAADIQLLLEKLAQAQDLLKGMTPAVLKPPPLPSAPPKPKPPKKIVKPPEKPEEKVTIKQLTQAAIKLLTAEAKAHAKELAKIKGDIRRKVFIIELWEKECKRNPDSLACQAYMKLNDEQREAILTNILEAVKQAKPAPAPPKEKPVAKPAPAPPVVSEEVAAEKAEEIVEALEKKWRDAKARNSKLAEADLDELKMRWGYDVEEAREKLQEYKDTARADFESAEEYSEARADAWQEFVDSIGTISKEEEEEEVPKAAPPTEK